MSQLSETPNRRSSSSSLSSSASYLRASSTQQQQQQFSPIRVESPYPPAGVNLTGLPRRVKDSCADVYNACRRWDKAKLRGVKTIRRIAALRSDPEPDELTLCQLCDGLVECVDELDKCLGTIASVRKNFEALVKIDRLKMTPAEPTESTTAATAERCKNCGEIAFLSYSLEKYLDMIRSVECAYQSELELKRALIKRAPLQNRRSLFTFVNVCWMYDPLVTEDVTRTVLALVAECGFK